METLNLRINREIRAPKVRVIDKDGGQVGVLTLAEALAKAEAAGLDLVEIAPSAEPPVCKIIDFGKYRYQLTKKEKEQKKSQHQVKVKEIKIKPNTDEHDLVTKMKHAREFIAKGNKVRLTCVFRGREMAPPRVWTARRSTHMRRFVRYRDSRIAGKNAGPQFIGRVGPRSKEKTSKWRKDIIGEK